MNLFDENIIEEFDFAFYKEKASNLISPVYNDQPFDLIEIIQELIVLEKDVIVKRGKNKNRIENQILLQISLLFDQLSADYKHEYVLLNDTLIIDTKNNELQRFHALSLLIFQFIHFIFDSCMTNDNFSSSRKGFAIRLFCSLLFDYDLKNKFEFINKALCSGKSKLIIETLDELKNLIEKTNFELSTDLIKTLYQLINKSNDRSVVVNCLNVLISIGKESEGSAFMKIEDWKYKNYDYR